MNFQKVELAKSLNSRSSNSVSASDLSLVIFVMKFLRKSFWINFTALLVFTNFNPFWR